MMRSYPESQADAPDELAAAHSWRLAELIRGEAAVSGGLLPFDRFMELALYAPGFGYYVAGAHKLGEQGDFVTAPEISPLFGRCIAEQCREVLDALEGGVILEFGAGTGALSAEILSTLCATESLPGHYYILEPSPDLRERQQGLLAERVPDLLPRIQWLDRLPTGFRGCVLANEVLDAMPVHRFRIGEEHEPLELFVKPSEVGWEEVAGAPVSPGLLEEIQALQDEGLAIDPGYESEINLRSGPWVRALAESMDAGLVLLVDYGYTRREYYVAERSTGTLMCHYRQTARADPYCFLGLQDITAHVDFTRVAQAASRSGFGLAGFTSQANFLIGCGLDRVLAQAAQDPDAMDLVLGAKQLVLPSAMGERFQVLGLQKGLDRGWIGFSFRDLRDRLGVCDQGTSE